jgi:hypothetical protein
MVDSQPKTAAFWWQYKDAGTCPNTIDLGMNQSTQVEFTAPKVKEKCTLHFILEVKDNGSPAQKSFERVIVTVKP